MNRWMFLTTGIALIGAALLVSAQVAPQEHKAAATNRVKPAGNPRRLLVFSKFQYWPAKKAYVVVNGVRHSVYFHKIATD